MIFKTKLIPYSVPQMEHKSLGIILKKILSGRVNSGKAVRVLEKEFADYIGTKHAVCFASGRYSLYLLYKFFGCSGKKVLLPSYTCIAAIDGARWARAEPVFMDIDPENYNPLWKEEYSKIKNVGAISLSYLYGLVGDIEPFLEFSKKHKVPIIEDAAICLGGEHHGKKVGSFGDAAIFSFQSSKIITAWRGGIITTNNEELYKFLLFEREKLRYPKKLKLIFNLTATYARRILSGPRVYGLTLYPIKKILSSKYFGGLLGKIMDQNPLEAVDGLSPQEIPNSEKYRFTNLQAAIALHSFRKIEKILDRRRKNIKFIIEELNKVPSIIFPQEPKDKRYVYGRFPMRIKGRNKFEIEEKLLKAGIETALYYPYICPCTEYMKKYRFNSVDYPNALTASKETILLPAYGYMRRKEAKFMVRKIKEIAEGKK